MLGQPVAEAGVGGFAVRLRSLRPTIERAVAARVRGVADPDSIDSPDYAAGLRAAVSAAVGYGIECATRGERSPRLVPAELSTQARLAARHGVPLDTVVRSCVAGYFLLCDFIIEAARDGSELRDVELQSVLRTEASHFDRLLQTVSEEYRREIEDRALGSHERRADRVRRLLAGEPLDANELRYPFDGWHVAAIAVGVDLVEERLRDLAAALDRALLVVRCEEEMVWAWLGGRGKLSAREAVRLVAATWPPESTVVFGESQQGLEGWRLSHRQALATMSVARRMPHAATRYGEVSLLASMLQDEVLVRSLSDTYLTPLAGERDGGRILRETLRAYFQAERNASSAAAALSVSRKTVANRLRIVEERLECPLGACAAELEAALRLADLDA